MDMDRELPIANCDVDETIGSGKTTKLCMSYSQTAEPAAIYGGEPVNIKWIDAKPFCRSDCAKKIWSDAERDRWMKLLKAVGWMK